MAGAYRDRPKGGWPGRSGWPWRGQDLAGSAEGDMRGWRGWATGSAGITFSVNEVTDHLRPLPASAPARCAVNGQEVMFTSITCFASLISGPSPKRLRACRRRRNRPSGAER